MKKDNDNKGKINLSFDNLAIPEVHLHKSDKHQEEAPNQQPIQYDNVAIPEVHTHKSDKHEEEKPKHSPINYENVAIPEVHIRTKKNK